MTILTFNCLFLHILLFHQLIILFTLLIEIKILYLDSNEFYLLLKLQIIIKDVIVYFNHLLIFFKMFDFIIIIMLFLLIKS